jgi:hypothetical protein
VQIGPSVTGGLNRSSGLEGRTTRQYLSEIKRKNYEASFDHPDRKSLALANELFDRVSVNELA